MKRLKIKIEFVLIVFLVILCVTRDFWKSLVYTEITIETIEWFLNRLN